LPAGDALEAPEDEAAATGAVDDEPSALSVASPDFIAPTPFFPASSAGLHAVRHTTTAAAMATLVVRFVKFFICCLTKNLTESALANIAPTLSLHF
jgi:hypothetical protein